MRLARLLSAGGVTLLMLAGCRSTVAPPAATPPAPQPLTITEAVSAKRLPGSAVRTWTLPPDTKIVTAMGPLLVTERPLPGEIRVMAIQPDGKTAWQYDLPGQKSLRWAVSASGQRLALLTGIGSIHVLDANGTVVARIADPVDIPDTTMQFVGGDGGLLVEYNHRRSRVQPHSVVWVDRPTSPAPELWAEGSYIAATASQAPVAALYATDLRIFGPEGERASAHLGPSVTQHIGISVTDNGQYFLCANSDWLVLLEQSGSVAWRREMSRAFPYRAELAGKTGDVWLLLEDSQGTQSTELQRINPRGEITRRFPLSGARHFGLYDPAPDGSAVVVGTSHGPCVLTDAGQVAGCADSFRTSPDGLTLLEQKQGQVRALPWPHP